MPLPPTWSLFGKDHLPHRLLLLARMIDRETARQLQEQFNLSLAEWRVLAFICTVGPSSAAQVCLAFDVDRAEVSRAVAKLAEAGNIEREADPGNRKKLVLRPTAQGAALFDKARLQRQTYFQSIMIDLDEESRDKFDAMLNTIANAL